MVGAPCSRYAPKTTAHMSRCGMQKKLQVRGQGCAPWFLHDSFVQRDGLRGISTRPGHLIARCMAQPATNSKAYREPCGIRAPKGIARTQRCKYKRLPPSHAQVQFRIPKHTRHSAQDTHSHSHTYMQLLCQHHSRPARKANKQLKNKSTSSKPGSAYPSKKLAMPWTLDTPDTPPPPDTLDQHRHLKQCSPQLCQPHCARV
jgi:hypothetical protein